jgi:hypothetical protein
MTISDHEERFAGKRIVNWAPGAPLPDPAASAIRLALDWDLYEKGEKLPAWVERLAAAPRAGEIEALVIGAWDFESSHDSREIVEALVSARGKLRRLSAVFLGDITFEEQEISWIQQSDVSPILRAFPELEELRVRGGTGLALERPDHARLRKLVIETGGLPAEVVRSVAKADLPALRHLELWLGSESYGADATPADVAPILGGALLPSLRYLGLRDSEIADDLAAAVATAPILSRVRVLDLSLGTLGDVGAEHLLASPAVAALEKLDLHHHFISPELQARLARLSPVVVDLSDPKHGTEEEEYRYCAVAE